MAEIQKIGHWFFAADRVATIGCYFTGLRLWATPLPFINDDGEEVGVEWLDENIVPSDIMGDCVSVDMSDGHAAVIICDIPDNYALYIGDENGDAPAEGVYDEPLPVHWSKR